MITSSHKLNVCHFCCACNLERVTMSKTLLKMVCKFHNLKHYLKKLFDSNLNMYQSLILICDTLILQFIIYHYLHAKIIDVIWVKQILILYFIHSVLISLNLIIKNC